MADMPRPAKAKKDYYVAVGRRKRAVARVRGYTSIPVDLMFGDYVVKKGDLVVNKKNISEYFKGDVSRAIYEKPLKVVDGLNKYAFTIRVEGGGPSSQLGAVVLGMSRALSLMDGSFRKLLKKEKLLTRDQRKRQRRMVGMGGKSRARKQSPKR